jgi:hypothetical protein
MADQGTDIVILRDGEGNYYLIAADAVQAGRVPSDKAQLLEKAIAGDVSGFFLDSVFQSQFAGLSQNNTNRGANTIIGGLAAFNNQNLSQLGVNVGSVNASQSGRA